MPVYVAHIFAWLRHRVWSREVARWAALAAGYAVVLTGYVALLIALFDPRSAVMVARVIVLFAAFAGVSVLAVRFGRLWGERRATRIALGEGFANGFSGSKSDVLATMRDLDVAAAEVKA